MRKIKRRDLNRQAATYLRRKKSVIAALSSPARAEAVRKMWPSTRKTKTFQKGVLDLLCQMAGQRQRCMYCEDSRGTDVEHFWPKSVFPAEKAFDWLNMLLACINCQRAKGNRLPLDTAGLPLLIDPTRDEPWSHLFFVPETGRITARFDPETGQEDSKGGNTVRDLHLDYEILNEGRRRVTRNLGRAVSKFIQDLRGGFSSVGRSESASELRKAVEDNSAYGLGQWFFQKDGQAIPPFSELRKLAPDVFEDLRQIVE